MAECWEWDWDDEECDDEITFECYNLCDIDCDGIEEYGGDYDDCMRECLMECEDDEG